MQTANFILSSLEAHFVDRFAISVPEVAAAIGYSEETIRKALKAGELPYFTLSEDSNQPRIRLAQLAQWIEEREAANGERR